jgi:type IVB pilus formation R64 PilN family outer membrane protein
MKYTLITIAIAILSGCATYDVTPRVAVAKKQAEKLLAIPVKPVDANPVSFSEESWIPLRRIDRSDRDLANLKADGVQIEINQRFTSLNDVAGTISSLAGMPVAIESDVNSMSVRTSQADSASTFAALTPQLTPQPVGLPVGAMPRPMPTPLNGPQMIGQSIIPSGQISVSSPFSANYSGNLTGFMNIVSAYYGISWKTESSGLRFFVMESKTFRIAALPGDTRLNSVVESTSSTSTGNQGATQSGGSANSTGVTFAGLSVWASLESSIKQMLSTAGRVVASPATGTITVTDTPSIMARVSEFVKDQNQALNRQVTVNVRVLSVDVNDTDDYGINWDAVYSNLTSVANPYSFAIKSALPLISGAGNIVLSAPRGSVSKWAGSSAMIAALSTQGRVSELTSATLVTLNNQPAPINVGRRVSYLASSSTTQTTGAGATTTLMPGTVQTGFSMTLVPHIINGHELLLQYSIDISSLLRLSTIDSGSSSIQTPDISTSNFIQRVRLQSGETLVVAGFDQDNLSAVSNGVGIAVNPLLGTRAGKTKRSMLVVMIQPTLAP